MGLWLIIIHDPADGIRSARVFAKRDDAIRAIRAVICDAEREFEPSAADAAMVKWDKLLAELTEEGGDALLETDWDSNALISLREATME
jgi:hypothetical protein